MSQRGLGIDGGTLQSLAIYGTRTKVEGKSYGTPAFHVDKKLFVRFHQSGESVVIMIHVNEREALMRIDPETFYITNHNLNYPAMLVRLSTVQPDDLRKLITESWRRSAPAKLVAAYDKRP